MSFYSVLMLNKQVYTGKNNEVQKRKKNMYSNLFFIPLFFFFFWFCHYHLPDISYSDRFLVSWWVQWWDLSLASRHLYWNRRRSLVRFVHLNFVRIFNGMLDVWWELYYFISVVFIPIQILKNAMPLCAVHYVQIQIIGMTGHQQKMYVYIHIYYINIYIYIYIYIYYINIIYKYSSLPSQRRVCASHC